jgi:hypothetical protein
MVALQNPVLEQVIQSLGFKDSETFLKIQAQSLLLQKIAYYRSRIDLFVKKYGVEYDGFLNRFNDFSQSLVEKENDGQDWDDAIDFVNIYQQRLQEIL